MVSQAGIARRVEYHGRYEIVVRQPNRVEIAEPLDRRAIVEVSTPRVETARDNRYRALGSALSRTWTQTWADRNRHIDCHRHELVAVSRLGVM